MKSAFLGGKMNDFCLKQGQGLKASMAQSSIQTSQVPPPPLPPWIWLFIPTPTQVESSRHTNEQCEK